MPFSLYAATVPNYQQILKAICGLLDKAEAFCAEKSLAFRLVSRRTCCRSPIR